MTLVNIMFCLTVITVIVSFINWLDYYVEGRYKSSFACYSVTIGCIFLSKMREDLIEYLEGFRFFFNYTRDEYIALGASVFITALFISQLVIFIKAYKSDESFIVSIYRNLRS